MGKLNTELNRKCSGPLDTPNKLPDTSRITISSLTLILAVYSIIIHHRIRYIPYSIGYSNTVYTSGHHPYMIVRYLHQLAGWTDMYMYPYIVKYVYVFNSIYRGTENRAAGLPAGVGWGPWQGAMSVRARGVRACILAISRLHTYTYRGARRSSHPTPALSPKPPGARCRAIHARSH